MNYAILDGKIVLKENLVEVVRCNDCKFYWKNSRNADGVACLATPKDDAFCSEGERIEDANTHNTNSTR